MVGARTTGSLFGVASTLIERNSAGTFAADDLVKGDGSSGEAVVATAGSLVLGVAVESATSASTGVQIDATFASTVLMDNDNTGTTFAATHVDRYVDMIGGTGAIVIDTSSVNTTVATFKYLEYNPQGYGLDSDTSIARLLIMESELGSLAIN